MFDSQSKELQADLPLPCPCSFEVRVDQQLQAISIDDPSFLGVAHCHRIASVAATMRCP